jgi:hypothetical protein
METEIKTIERLIRQGSTDEELFKKYPKHIDHINSYREFLIEQSKPYIDTDMAEENFIKEVFEIAFGDNAIHRGFAYSEVLSSLKKDSETIGKIHKLLDERI